MGIESLGVPAPGETTLLIGIVLAVQGRLSVAVVAMVAWGGAVVGDNLGYAVGRRYGTRLVRLPVVGRLYSEERLARAERLFARRGWLAVFGGRFVALLRIFAGPLAGMHRMPWRSFVVANASGAAVWVAAVTIAGLLIGNNLDRAATLLTRISYAGLALLVVMILVGVGWRARRRWKETHG